MTGSKPLGQRREGSWSLVFQEIYSGLDAAYTPKSPQLS